MADDKIVWQNIVDAATADLSEPQQNSGEFDNDVRRIVEAATGTDPDEWFEVLAQQPTQRQVAAFDKMLVRRSIGEPLQYVVGSWSFRMLDLFVDKRVLIPRPETEVVAETASKAFAKLKNSGALKAEAPIVDLGTGSGAIGLSLAFDHRGAEVWLTDNSADALAVARANLASLGSYGSKVRLAEGSWFEALPAELEGKVGLIVSNPPYVGSRDEVEQQVKNWEPAEALYAEDEGTEHLRTIIDHAPRWLEPSGLLVLEMAPTQVSLISDYAAPHFAEIETVVDLAGRDRAIVARAPAREP